MQEEGSSSNERRYPLREKKPLDEWQKDHIFPQVSEEHANVALLADLLSLYDAMKSTDALKWENAMEEEYNHSQAMEHGN